VASQIKLRKTIYKAILVNSLALFVASIFLPWLSEYGISPLAISPRIRIVSQFWSFQAVINVFSGDRLITSHILRFQNLWFDREFGGYPNAYQGWMWLFMFQLLAVASGFLSIVREKVRGHPLPLISAISTSAVTLILGYHQLIRHSTSGRGFSSFSVNIDTGFLLAPFSVVLWLISLMIYVRSSKETNSCADL